MEIPHYSQVKWFIDEEEDSIIQQINKWAKEFDILITSISIINNNVLSRVSAIVVFTVARSITKVND